MRTDREIREIERHKYFMSEKAGHDVGWDAAERDWDARYGAERSDAESRGGAAGEAAPAAQAETATATLERPSSEAPKASSTNAPPKGAPGLRAKLRDALARVFSS